MSFPKWLRSNSEHYLLCDAQDRVARQKGFNPPNSPHGLKDRFWRQVFVPVYRVLPWGLRRVAIQALPGSHRKPWPKRSPRSPMP
jgi:hypothetical protein